MKVALLAVTLCLFPSFALAQNATWKEEKRRELTTLGDTYFVYENGRTKCEVVANKYNLSGDFRIAVSAFATIGSDRFRFLGIVITENLYSGAQFPTAGATTVLVQYPLSVRKEKDGRWESTEDKSPKFFIEHCAKALKDLPDWVRKFFGEAFNLNKL